MPRDNLYIESEAKEKSSNYRRQNQHYKTARSSNKVIAEKYRVGKSTISDIKKNKEKILTVPARDVRHGNAKEGKDHETWRRCTA